MNLKGVINHVLLRDICQRLPLLKLSLQPDMFDADKWMSKVSSVALLHKVAKHQLKHDQCEIYLEEIFSWLRHLKTL